MSEEKSKSVEELVDEMIGYIKKFPTQNGIPLTDIEICEQYVDMCEQAVYEAKEALDGSEDAQTIYEDSKEFLRVANLRLEEV